jgi:hypothetical protein
VDRGTPPTWTLTRSTAPSHVAAIERIPSGGPIRLPLMIADPAYHLSRPATASKPVKRCCAPPGPTRGIYASSVPTKTTFPIGTQHESANSLFAIAVHSPSEDRRQSECPPTIASTLPRPSATRLRPRADSLSERFRPPRKKGPFSAHSCSTSFGFCGLFHMDCLTVRIESSADSDLLSFMRLHQILAVDVIARAASVL